MINKAKIFFIILIFILSKINLLLGARPLMTDDAATVDKGNTEIEIGYNFNKANKEDIKNSQSVEFNFKHGITDNFYFAFSFPYELLPVHGLSILTLKTKLILIKDQKIIPDAALSFIFSPGSSIYMLNGIFTKKIIETFLHINFAYEISLNLEETGNYFIGVATENNYIENFIFSFELTTKTDKDFINKTVDFLIGFRYKVTENFILDAGYSVTINEDKKPFKITTGVTIGI